MHRLCPATLFKVQFHSGSSKVFLTRLQYRISAAADKTPPDFRSHHGTMHQSHQAELITM